MNQTPGNVSDVVLITKNVNFAMHSLFETRFVPY